MAISASISEIYDLNTEVGKGTVLKVHTPVGNNVKRHLMGYFLQYKKWKYVGAKVTLVPASTLPADPLQLGYDAGEPTIDPRDMVNPILWRHYHGEAMLTDGIKRQFPMPYGTDDYMNSDIRKALNSEPDYPGTSIDKQEYQNVLMQSTGGGTDYDVNVIYPMCLMDPSFRKAGVQAGFSTFVKPYVYNLVTNNQVLSQVNQDNSNKLDFAIGTQGNGESWEIEADDPVQSDVTGNTLRPQYSTDNSGIAVFTNKLQRLGWLDTVTRVYLGNGSWTAGTEGNPAMGNYGGVGGAFAMQTLLPNIPMLYIMMPPAYKTMFYFRMVIKHYFQFAGFRSCMNVQSFPSASASPVFPLQAAASTLNLSNEIAEMAKDASSGGPDSLVVENGNIASSADGVL